MSIRQKAAQFFQNVADCLDPRAAWERKRVVHHELNRRAEGNFTGRDWTPEETYQRNVESFRQGLQNWEDSIAKIRKAKTIEMD